MNKQFFELQTGDKFYRTDDLFNGQVTLMVKMPIMKIQVWNEARQDYLYPVTVNAMFATCPGMFDRIEPTCEVVLVK